MIAFLLKGLLRDPSRSVFPILVVLIGVSLTVLAQTYMTGVFGNVITANAAYSTGHVKVMTRAYQANVSQTPNDLAILESGSVAAQLGKQFPEIEWRHRIRFGGLLDIPDSAGETFSQGPVSGLAFNLLGTGTDEIDRLHVARSLVRGRMPTQPGEVLVSDTFAHKLGLQPGGEATLIGSTMYGSMSMTNFRVVGTVRFGIEAMDRGTMLVDIEDIRRALDMQDATGELFGFFRSGKYDDQQARQIAGQFNLTQANSEDEFAPIMQALSDQNGLEEVIVLSRYYVLIASAIFAIAMSLVLWNVGLISGLRRYGEVGLRLAIGETKHRVYASVVVEAAMVGLAGSLLGTLIGLSLSWTLEQYPLDISNFLQGGSMMLSSTLGASVTPTAYYIGLIPGVLATVTGAALSGIGIYRRQTAQLFKELES